MLSYICWMYNSFGFGSFCNDSLEVVKNLFVKQDWTIGYYGLFHLTYFKTVLEFLRKLITKYISEKKRPSGNV